jgi:hypothetical protein
MIKKEKNSVKQRSRSVNLVLEEEIKLNKVFQMVEKVLVGNFHGLCIGEKTLEGWLLANWEPL